jgi:hypothetical protein
MKLWLIAAILLVAFPQPSPQSISAKDVILQLQNPRITENGELIYDGGGDCAGGNMIAVHVPPSASGRPTD